ncbi:MAG: Holliday junction branch migration protein RuvA [Balneolaceae bacterium]|jgi:Holliday junction DNA helicase RuvA|nr:Holliday junction branch migration protein RuvA [Balneolaceae bacterium]MCR9133083.1 Holliday junction branch migration protein RuvA [bacterium]
MIAFLKGHIEESTEDTIFLDVNGVGYKVEVSTQTIDQLKGAGKDIKLLVYHHITDSDQRLFGFFTKDEKNLFEQLITVKGVGPKLGLTILSGLPASNLIGAITGGDAVALSRVPGIGKKTAERIIVELREKLKAFDTGDSVEISGAKSGVFEEAVQALQALGFKQKESEQAAMSVINAGEVSDSSAVIRKSLSLLNK